MTIFKDINELKNCILELEEYFPLDEFHRILAHIDKVKSLDLEDETKQNLCNNRIREALLRNKIVLSYKVIDWLEEKAEHYRDMIAYVRRENEWKKKKNIVIE